MTKRQWTIMIYMAGDNGKIFDDGKQLMADLSKEGWADIAEMTQAGFSDEVSVIVQYDTLEQTLFTPRYLINSDYSPQNPVEKIPVVDTGDPKNLTDFLVWCEVNYPAEKYALVLWNHGTGWREDDIYARYRDKLESPDKVEKGIKSGNRSKRLMGQSLFLATVGELACIGDDEIRGICYDDSSMSFLDNANLAKALLDAQEQTGNRLSLLGMDACLMSIIEVACQIQPYADYMVGSQEVEPVDGWPYKGILKGIMDQPTIDADKFSKIVVEKYGDRYMNFSRDGGGIKTQSAINLNLLPGILEKLKRFVEIVLELYSSKDLYVEIALGRAKTRAQRFVDQESTDLRDFFDVFEVEYEGNNADLSNLVADIIQHLKQIDSNNPVLANFHGSGRPNANGLSIYFPAQACSIYYDHQVFCDTGWNQLIRRVNNV